LPADALLARAAEPDVKQELIANTERAVARGVFGSPSFFVGDELFFGKDRLREVEEEIEAQRAHPGGTRPAVARG
jgi:2-hydroxychromene-2-carboxylate isomerase